MTQSGYDLGLLKGTCASTGSARIKFPTNADFSIADPAITIEFPTNADFRYGIQPITMKFPTVVDFFKTQIEGGSSSQ